MKENIESNGLKSGIYGFRIESSLSELSFLKNELNLFHFLLLFQFFVIWLEIIKTLV